MAYKKILSLTALPPGRAKAVTVEGVEIALFNVNGTIYAIEDACSHAGAPLSDGEVYDCEIECPLHGARFDLRTGEALSPPAFEPVRTFDVKSENGYIFVDI